MTMHKKLLFLAGMISMIGGYGCDSESEDPCEGYKPVCFDDSSQLRCGAHGVIYIQECSQGCVTESADVSICKGEEFCEPKCEAGYYCDYDTCKPGTKPVDPTPIDSECDPACATNEVCVNKKCRLPGTCDTKADCTEGQECEAGLCVTPQQKDDCRLDGTLCSSDEICNQETGECDQNPDFNCVENENDVCDDNHKCNTATGQCDPKTCDDIVCTNPGEYCDASTVKCIVNCTNENAVACNTGDICNTRTNACYTPECSDINPCQDSAFTCESNVCVPATKDCKTDGCPDNYECSEESNLCVKQDENCIKDGCPDDRNYYCNKITNACEAMPDDVSCGELSITDKSNTCEKTGSGSKIVLRGDVLGLEKTYVGGSVVIEGNKITYVGCAPELTNATVITCPDAVISPSFINGHEHNGYSNSRPGIWGDERFDHRYDWRKGANGHTKVPGPQTNDNEVVEVRALMAATTGIFGSTGNVSGLARNIDQNGLNGVKPVYQTFPLGDSTKNYTSVSSCSDYDYHSSVLKFTEECPYGPHIAEGINQGAYNELRCLNGMGIDGNGTGAKDIFKKSLAVIHGVAATPEIITQMAENNVKLVWSPRTNISLYGDTAQAPLYDTLGVTIGLGTDWIYSGSANVLRELACIDDLNKNYYGEYFSDYKIWKMPTYNSAVAFGLDGFLGQLKEGYIADIAIFKAYPNARESYRAVIEAENKDVTLVVIDGEFVYGDANLMSKGTDVNVCGVAKKFHAGVSVNGKSNSKDFSNIQASAVYPLFFCDTPEDEPTCTPMRTRSVDTTAQNTTLYTGDYTAADDADGDGIPDDVDNCPTIFNPIRPQYTDRKQADMDGDGLGDICDPYPTCALNDTSCPKFNPNDRDTDGVENLRDNCPDAANPDQADKDNDGLGDVCDPCDDRYDNDSDGLSNDCDACPDDGNNEDGKGCSLQMTSVQTLRTSFVGTSFTSGLVKTEGIVTAIAHKFDNSGLNGFFIQDPEHDAGVYIYNGQAAATVNVGDLVTVVGTTENYHGLLEIMDSTVTVESSGHSVTPIVLTAAQTTEGATDSASTNTYDSALVTVSGLTVDKYDTTIEKGEAFLCYDANMTKAYIDDFVMGNAALQSAVEVGTTYDVTGILVYDYKLSKIAPRSVDDLYAGLRVKSLTGPMDAKWSDNVQLTLTMSEAVQTATTVSIACDAGTCDSVVTVPANSATVDFSVIMPDSGNMTVTATYDTRSVKTTIIGNDGGEALIASTEPSALSLIPGGSKDVTVNFDRTVKANGTLTISASNGLTVPATVDVTAGSTSAEFSVTAAGDIVPGEYAISVAFNDGTALNIPVSVISYQTYTETFDGISSSNISSYLDFDFASANTNVTWEIKKGRTGLDAYAIDGAGIMFNQKDKTDGILETKLNNGLGTIKLQAKKAFSKTDARSIAILANGVEKCSFTLAAGDTTQDMPVCEVNAKGEVKLTIKQTGPQTTIDNIEWTTY